MKKKPNDREAASDRLLKDAERSDGTLAEGGGGVCAVLGTCCLGCRPALVRLADSAPLSNFSTTLVLVNIGLMCMGYEGMPEAYEEKLEFDADCIT